MQNSLYVQILRSPTLAAFVGISMNDYILNLSGFAEGFQDLWGLTSGCVFLKSSAPLSSETIGLVVFEKV